MKHFRIFAILIFILGFNCVSFCEEWSEYNGRPSFKYPSRFKKSDQSYGKKGILQLSRTLVFENENHEGFLLTDFGYISELEANTNGFDNPRDFFLSKMIKDAKRHQQGGLEVFVNTARPSWRPNQSVIEVYFLYSKPVFGQSFYYMKCYFPSDKEDKIKKELAIILKSLKW